MQTKGAKWNWIFAGGHAIRVILHLQKWWKRSFREEIGRRDAT